MPKEEPEEGNQARDWRTVSPTPRGRLGALHWDEALGGRQRPGPRGQAEEHEVLLEPCSELGPWQAASPAWARPTSLHARSL